MMWNDSETIIDKYVLFMSYASRLNWYVCTHDAKVKNLRDKLSILYEQDRRKWSPILIYCFF